MKKNEIKNKILDLNKLKEKIKKFKKDKKKVVLCHGVFDLLHIGHIKHFESAKKNGEILVVTITADEYVDKGPNRPHFSTSLRAEALSAIEIIDYISINYSSNAIDMINKIMPDIYFKGIEYKNNKSDLTGMIKSEKKAVKSVGGQIKYSDEQTFSSSSLLNEYGNLFSTSQKTYISKIKKKFSFQAISKMIESFSDTKVLIIGETIIDEYVFCEALGKSGKEPVLVFKDFGREQYLGGVLAIARHLSSFCKNISVLSLIGDKKEQEGFIKKNIEKNIVLNFLRKKNSPTIIKKRFIDRIDNRKIFGIYSLNDENLKSIEEQKIIEKLKNLYTKFDLIIVADYGHGMITPKIGKFISNQKKFLSLNAQINSTNIGLRSINKYNKIDNLVINASELRYEMNQRDGDLLKLAKKFKDKIKSKYLSVTQGKMGAFTIDEKNKIWKCPAFTNDPIDKIGAGDTFLSLLSLCKFKKLDSEFSLFLSSLVAAKSANTIGNKTPINKSKILKTILHLLK
jgi:rfaE bifunctional protein kinase chain/domain/rfaE bifunctional protein nucleotidyltransferase chain/domain